jgi:hypothetical protein
MNISLGFMITNGIIPVPLGIPCMDIGMEVDDPQDSAYSLQVGSRLNEFMATSAFVVSRKTRVTVAELEPLPSGSV